MGGLRILPLFFFLSLYAKWDQSFSLSAYDIVRIGQQIWYNECAGKIDGLTSWNKGEEFASLGIGHFIWSPTESLGPFGQTFPDLLIFFKQQGVKLPKWLEEATRCPWESREVFYQALQGPQMVQLRQLLQEHIDLQIIFMVKRLQKALPSILQNLSMDKIPHVIAQCDRLTETSMGFYALLDYINFKGEGILCQECYKGEGWGLRQVLELMPGDSSSPIKEFVEAAKKVLSRRVENSPPERNEQQWLKGWYNRIETYTHPCSK